MMSSVKRNVYYSVSTVYKFTVYTLYTPTPTHTHPTHTYSHPHDEVHYYQFTLETQIVSFFVRTLLTQIDVPIMKGHKSFFKLCNLQPFITGTSINDDLKWTKICKIIFYHTFHSAISHVFSLFRFTLQMLSILTSVLQSNHKVKCVRANYKCL